MSTRKIIRKSKGKRNTKKCEDIHLYKKFEAHYTNRIKKGETLESTAVSILNAKFTPPKYKLADDFYTYINYDWIDNISKKYNRPKHYVQLDTVRITQEEVYYELIGIVKQYIKQSDTKLSKAIKNVYDSLYNLDNASAETYFAEYNKYIEEQVSSGDIYDILSNQNRNELISSGSPIVWGVSIDNKNSTIYKSTISPPTLTLYDNTIYFENDGDDKHIKSYKRQVKTKYIEYVNAIFSLCLGRNNKHLAEDVWDCECIMAKAMKRIDETTEYFPVNRNNAVEDYGLDWNTFSKKLGYVTTPQTFICTNDKYLQRIMAILSRGWNKPKWVTYYLYTCFKQAARFHNKGMLIHYKFHEHFIAGVQTPYPRELYPIFGLSMCFNTFLSNEYTSRHENLMLNNYVKDLSDDLLIVFKRIIGRNNWLSLSAKKRALIKLNKIKLLVGSPTILREDPLLNYDSKGAFQNMIKISDWRTNKYIEMDGKSNTVDVPSIDWNTLTMTGKQSYNVNAYYLPNENTIYIPYAYLQEPFIDLNERGIEYNLATIGFTLAHEMSHCLDDLGIKYDENGNLCDWLSPKDKKMFTAKVKNINNHYETFASYDGIEMDASLSVGENIADISGLAICEEYLQDVHDKNDYNVPTRTLSFQTFFVHTAFQSRQKIYDKAVKAQLKVNPHPMEKYRVNCPLSRLKLFKNIYNIKKGDKMYWPNVNPFW